MIFTEWNLDDAIEVAKEDLFALLRQGYSVDEVEKLLVTQN